jgi:1,4-dihydroxy-2-naphthoate polyprenyltransferase
MKQRLRAWIKASRPPFYIATVIPLTIGWILGAKNGDWHVGRFLLINLGAFMIHMATNLVNDFADHLQGADAGESIGGSRVIQEGTISIRSLGCAIILLYSLAAIVAFYLMGTLNLWPMLPVLLFSFFSSLFYVTPPIRYGYHGLGELFVGLNMGPVMVVCTYWAISLRVDWVPFCVSIPIGFMVASILYYQSLPDMQTDAAIGKRTLAVRLGKQGALTGLILFWVSIYLAIIILILAGVLAWPAFASFLTLPIFMKMGRTVRKTTDWVQLNQYGKYVRMLYFFNGLVIIISLLLQ